MKDYTRDYAAAAFRFYAQNGLSAANFKQNIYVEALSKIVKRETCSKSGIGKPTEAALMEAEKAMNERLSEILDMEAVEKVLKGLEASGNSNVIRAVQVIYFNNADNEFSFGDIQDKVREASIKIPAGERSIYRWLKQARELFAYERGLRINFNIKNFKRWQ